MGENIYIGYSKDDFFYNLTREEINNTNDKNESIIRNIQNSSINPTDEECTKLLNENWTDMSCSYYLFDNSTNCIKNEICKNKYKVDNIDNIDDYHKSFYARNLELDDEFKNVFLDTINLGIGIIFIIILIFKATSMNYIQK